MYHTFKIEIVSNHNRDTPDHSHLPCRRILAASRLRVYWTWTPVAWSSEEQKVRELVELDMSLPSTTTRRRREAPAPPALAWPEPAPCLDSRQQKVKVMERSKLLPSIFTLWFICFPSTPPKGVQASIPFSVLADNLHGKAEMAKGELPTYKHKQASSSRS